MAINVLDAQHLFQQVNAYANRHGFSGGFPVFHRAWCNRKAVFGAYFLHSAERVWIHGDFLKDVETEEDLMNAVNEAALTLGFGMGFPTYTCRESDEGPQQEAIFLERNSIDTCLVNCAELDFCLEDKLTEKIRKVQAYARSRGYTSALPCGSLTGTNVMIQLFRAEALTWKVLTEAELAFC